MNLDQRRLRRGCNQRHVIPLPPEMASLLIQTDSVFWPIDEATCWNATNHAPAKSRIRQIDFRGRTHGPNGAVFSLKGGESSGVVSKRKCPLLVTNEVSGFINHLVVVVEAVGKCESRAFCGICKCGEKVVFLTFPLHAFSTALICFWSAVSRVFFLRCSVRRDVLR